MYELPLFPLNTVLFPGLPLYLHIFEERYKRMIRLCIQNRQPFGVVLIRRGAEALGPLAEPYPVGCSAKITEVKPLAEGRMNITAVGHQRFRILSLHDEHSPYLVGAVETYPLALSSPLALANGCRELRRLVDRYLRRLVEVGKSQFELSQLPDNPLELAYLAASLLQLSPVEKQELLAAESAEWMMGRLTRVYRREMALLDALLTREAPVRGGFSAN